MTALAELKVPLAEPPISIRRTPALGGYGHGHIESHPERYLELLPDTLGAPETTSADVLTAAGCYLDWNMRDPAIAVLRESITGDLAPETRAKISAMLAYRSFARPGTTNCGVPGCTGDPAPQKD